MDNSTLCLQGRWGEEDAAELHEGEHDCIHEDVMEKVDIEGYKTYCKEKMYCCVHAL